MQNALINFLINKELVFQMGLVKRRSRKKTFKSIKRLGGKERFVKMRMTKVHWKMGLMVIVLPQMRINKPEDAQYKGGCLSPDTTELTDRF